MAKGIFLVILIWLREQFDTVVDFLASLYWDPKKEVLPPLDKNSKILLESATSLAQKIRKKQLKSEDLVKICVERIKLINPIINAVTDERYHKAIEEAQEVDRQINAGISDEEFDKKPFLGIPFTSKESFAASGMIHSLGLVERSTTRAEEDAEAIRLMKAAGAILVAVSNVPEINKWQETRNMVVGQTCNPYHIGCSVGGSSGGEAALVASVCSPIGLGSDIGGSTRMPAYYCGLFGHYPTASTTNMRGGTFRSGLETNSMVSVGPIVKHSVDLKPILKILTAEKGEQLKLDEPVDLSKLNYYYVKETNDNSCSLVQSEVKDAMNQVIELLKETVARNNPPVEVKCEGFQYMYKLWRYWMSREPQDFPYLLGNMRRRPNGIIELLKKLIGASEFTFAGIIGLLDAQVLPPVKEEWALPIYEKLRKELLETLGSNGVLIFYSTTQTAPYHYTPFLRPFNFSYWCIFNALKFPSTQVPLGLDSEGLPLGIQVVSAPYNDRLCLAVAKHLEESFQGFVPPCNTIE